MLNINVTPVILIILDGWGYSEKYKGNAIAMAHTPTLDNIWKNYPFTLLAASGKDVGLPEKQMGNSEVGHTTIGSGRIINQDLVRINQNIESKQFAQNLIIQQILQLTHNNKSKLHIIGLCSNGGVHSHINHLLALINIVKTSKIYVCLHIITDGRDTEPKSANVFIQTIMDEIKDYNHIQICTISGRYYSMDRDCRWSRTEKAYKTLIEDNLHQELSPLESILQYYQQNISDEFIPPTRINKGCIEDYDSIVFFNFRPDRIRQLVYALAQKNFKGFEIKKMQNINIATFSQYDAKLNIPIIFPPEKHKKFLGEVLSEQGLKQLRLAETEKYAHVTYFFNGGKEEPLAGEDRELICSPQVETYDLSPDMSANKLTTSLIAAIDTNMYDLIVVNYANPDMVGHTGDLSATIQAITSVDECIEKLRAHIKHKSYQMIITADHGNAECMINDNNKPCKSHTTNLVPFSLITHPVYREYQLRSSGTLADIAPTILHLLNIKIPLNMNGHSLINNIKAEIKHCKQSQ